MLKTNINFLSVLLIFLFLSIQHLTAQAQSISFNKVLPPEGKTFHHITGMVQDKEGYMWFASKKGLYRYDGYNIVSYKNDPLNPNSLGADLLESIAIDSSGILWIGGFGSGLDRFDPIMQRFTHFHYDPKNKTGLSNDTVFAILQDHRGALWIGTPGGLDRLDRGTGRFIHYRHQANDPNSLSCNMVRTIYEDNEGTLWIGTGSPYEGPAEEGGLNKLDTRTGKFIRYTHDPGNPHSLVNNKIGAIFEDSKGNFWIGTAGDGLHTMDRVSGTFERYGYDADNPEKLSRSPLNKNLVYDHITFIKEDASGALWIGTSDAGVSRYDTTTKKVKHYQSNNIATAELLGGVNNDNTSWAAFSSGDGIFWISTILGNLFRVDPFNRELPFISLGNKVNSVYEERSGKLWIATENGVYVDSLSHSKQLTPHLINNTTNVYFTKIIGDRKGNIWFASYYGLAMSNKKKQNSGTYQHDDKDSKSLADNFVTSIYEDDQSNFWIGTAMGLDQMNRSTGTFIHYRTFPQDTGRYSVTNIITSICEDNQGKICIGSLVGVHQLNKKNGTFKNYIAGSEIRSIYRDADGKLWVGADDGLYQYNASSDIFSRFIDPSSSRGIDNVRSIIEDNDKKLWIATDEGILQINSQRNISSLFGKNYKIDGSKLTYDCSYKSPDGKLYFGASTGFYVFDPRQLTSHSKPPQIIFSGFRIADKLVRPGNNNEAAGVLFNASEIRLHYDQNVFSLEFVAIDYTNPQDNRYLFMLENYDNTWHKVGSDHSASFYDVPPGKYIFKVKAANSDGPWAEKSIAIIITPPWWRTWWAYCIYGLLFIAGLYAIHHFQKEKVVRAERERSQTKELAQAKEIEKAYTELKATQAQLIQSEKMASLGELTAGIAHEIQNPLNFVNNFSEVNKELLVEVKDEMQKGNYNDAKQIIEDVIGNEEKINHHGKRADAIVKGMLQHSQTNTGQKEPTDINKLADEYLRLAYHGLRAKEKTFNATLQTDYDESIGNINIIPQDVGRVLLNLYNNAFYAVDEKKKQQPVGYEPTVSASTKKAGNKIEISVKDNGNGIPQKIVDKIFQPFFTTKPTGQGTGLGLSLSYDIVKAHGGEIKVNTIEGKSTEFLIQLPIAIGI